MKASVFFSITMLLLMLLSLPVELIAHSGESDNSNALGKETEASSMVMDADKHEKLRKTMEAGGYTGIKPDGEYIAREDYGEIGIRANAGRDLEKVGIKEKVGNNMPVNALFTNQFGEELQLSQFFGAEADKPVLLSFYYASCSSLCQFVLNEKHALMQKLPLENGEDYVSLSISFDSRDTVEDIHTLSQKYRKNDEKSLANKQESDWIFLRGDKQNVQRVTSSLGFFYDFIEKSGEFAHTAAIYVISPQGKISRYFYGLNYPIFDVKMAVIEAKAEKIRSTLDRVLLYCYRYNDEASGYVLYAAHFMKAGGLTIMAFLGFLFFFMFRHERNRKNIDYRSKKK